MNDNFLATVMTVNKVLEVHAGTNLLTASAITYDIRQVGRLLLWNFVFQTNPELLKCDKLYKLSTVFDKKFSILKQIKNWVKYKTMKQISGRNVKEVCKQIFSL